MEHRLFEIEKRIVYLEKYIEDLNNVVVEQQQIIDRLKKHLSRLEGKIVLSPLQEDRPHCEKPPHY
ncbi:MAG: SlyX family protein [Candidatus Riflebacteria bacterium]|nr:SlyX family protein [Candidatus Riflebacteria bacterium]